MSPAHRPAAPTHRTLLFLIPAVLVILAIHLGPAAYAITNWRWSLTAILITAILVAAKALLLIAFRIAPAHRK